MLYIFLGTDREKARSVLNEAITRATGKTRTTLVRITDAHALEDLHAALEGGGMFGGARVVVFEGALEHEEMRPLVLDALKKFAGSSDTYFMLEEKPDAATRRKLEKYAEKVQKFDAGKGGREDSNVFALASCLRRGDRKALWVTYQRALAKGERPEALHGILFWGAKKMFLASRVGTSERRRAETLLAELAELPHEARRRSFELEYALERYLLNINKA